MAYVKVSTTRNVIAALRYGEHEKNCEKSGVECPTDTETAARLFRADRLMWNKDSGLQGHVIIQSFGGVECSPQDANRLGQELARRVAPGYRAMVYTHEDSKGGNIHNHIVIESVRAKDGRKLDTHGFLQASRAKSDELAKEAGLSLIEKGRGAGQRYTQAEAGLIERGKTSWKDETREAVEEAAGRARNEKEFRELMQKQGFKINERVVRGEKTWTYQHPNGMRVRAAKLGDDYTRGEVCRDWDRAAEKARQQEAVRQRQLADRAARQAERDARARQEKKKERGGGLGSPGRMEGNDDIDWNDPTISQMTKDEKSWEIEMSR